MSFKSKKCIGKISRKPLTSYESEEEAKAAIDYRKSIDVKYKPLCAYKCSKCGYYHLSPESRHTESTLCECLDSKGKKKRLYSTRESAQKRAKILQKENHITLYVYPCPLHKGFHLTHKLSNF